MIDLCTSHPETCCGCSACAAVCPKGAIEMKEAANGFLYPFIDRERCVECGLCVRTCDFKAFEPTGHKPASYAAKHVDEEEVRTSRSGAFFMAVCRYVIERGGVVFGAQMNEHLECVHTAETTYSGCQRFKGSKYVQSNPGSAYLDCAKALREGRYVCYSGTGCQVHGLLSLLRQLHVPTDRLLTVDLVCHGAPSPGVWKNYVALLGEKLGSKVISVDFRDKSLKGWSDHTETYRTGDGRVHHGKWWTDCFYRHILFREACFRCKYTTTQRKSDFTIADFWGVDRNAPEFNDNQGCSLVLVHSEKGRKVLSELGGQLKRKETRLESSLQPQLKKTTWRGWDYNWFQSSYEKNREKATRAFFFPRGGMLAVRKLEKCGKNAIKTALKLVKRR